MVINRAKGTVEHRTSRYHRVCISTKGPLRLQRHQGLPGPSVRQQGEDRRRDRIFLLRELTANCACGTCWSILRARSASATKALLRRRRPAGCRGDRQHHFARPHAAFPVRRLTRSSSRRFSVWARPAAQVGATRSSRRTPSATRRSSPGTKAVAARRLHALLQAPDEAHGDQGHRQVLHHAASVWATARWTSRTSRNTRWT